MSIKELEERIAKLEAERYNKCPNCGHCPACGRSNAPWAPYNQWWTYPYWNPTWVVTTGGDVASGSAGSLTIRNNDGDMTSCTVPLSAVHAQGTYTLGPTQ